MNNNNFISQKYHLILQYLAAICIVTLSLVGCTSAGPVVEATVTALTPTPQATEILATQTLSQTVATPTSNMPALQGMLLFTDYSGIYAFDLEKDTVRTLLQDPSNVFSNVNCFGNTIYFLRTTKPNAIANPNTPVPAGLGPSQIFRTSLDGSSVQQLTFGKGNIENLNLSPNGQYLSYSVDTIGSHPRFQLHLWNLRNKTDHVIAQNDTLDGFSSIVWSPDSSKVVFFNARLPGDSATPVIYDLNQKHMKTLLINGTTVNARLAWSPDGKNLVVGIMVKGQIDIYLYNVSDNTARQIVSTQGYPENFIWSPDGKAILYEIPQRETTNLGTDELFMYELEDEKTVIMQQGQLNGNFFSYNPVWIPDSNYVAYFTNAGSNNSQMTINLYDISTAQKYSPT